MVEVFEWRVLVLTMLILIRGLIGPSWIQWSIGFYDCSRRLHFLSGLQTPEFVYFETNVLPFYATDLHQEIELSATSL